MRSVKVRDYMTTNLVTFKPDTALFKAIGQLLERHVSGAPVVNEQGEVVGMLSERECLKRILVGSYHEEVGGAVADYMNPEVHAVAPGDDVVDVADVMTRNDWQAMPVLDQGRLVGIISCPDLLKVVYDFDTNPGQRA